LRLQTSLEQRRAKQLEERLEQTQKLALGVGALSVAAVLSANVAFRHRLAEQRARLLQLVKATEADSAQSKKQAPLLAKNAAVKNFALDVLPVVDSLRACRSNVEQELRFLSLGDSVNNGKRVAGLSRSQLQDAVAFAAARASASTQARTISDATNSGRISFPQDGVDIGRAPMCRESLDHYRSRIGLQRRGRSWGEVSPSSAAMENKGDAHWQKVYGAQNSPPPADQGGPSTPRSRNTWSPNSPSPPLEDAAPSSAPRDALLEVVHMRMQREILNTLLAGVEATEEELLGALRRQNIHPIAPTAGASEFDPEMHEALAERGDVVLNRVAAVERIGYYFAGQEAEVQGEMNGRGGKKIVLRPARVTVGTMGK